MATVDDQQHALYLAVEDGRAVISCAHHSCRFRREVDLPGMVEAFEAAGAEHDAPPEPPADEAAEASQ